MFFIGFSEILVILAVALIVLKPKDWPTLFNKAGRLFKKIKIISAHFHRTFEHFLTEIELEELKKEAYLKSKSSSPSDPTHHD